jgi:FkbM family methyltransferase
MARKNSETTKAVLSMTAAKPPKEESAKEPMTLWASVRWRVGHILDGIAWRLLVHMPGIARLYANLIAPKGPPTVPYPGWVFAAEYYPELRWMAWRRAALWDCARDRKLVVPLRVPWYDGTMVDVTLGNDQSMCLYVSGSFEPNEFVFLRGLLSPGMVAIDVGANEGLYTLFVAARVGPTGRAVAVEPSSRERATLQHNVDINRLANVTVVDSALGAALGKANLQIASGEHTGHNTLGSFVYDEVVAADSEMVTVETLDGLIERLALTRVDFVKVDVEGAETSVLRGAGNVLRRLRPLLLLEANEQALQAQGTSSAALVGMLKAEFRYEVLVFSETTGRVEVLRDGGALSSNIVAAPAERVGEILAKA